MRSRETLTSVDSISVGEASTLLQRSRIQIRNMLESGMPAVNGKIKWPEAFWWFIQRQIDKDKSKHPATNRHEIGKQRAEVELRRAEIDLAVAEGNFISVDEHIKRLTSICERLSAKCRAFPGKYAPKTVGIRTISEGQSLLESIMRDLLAALTETEADDAYEVDNRRERAREVRPKRKRGRPRGSRSAS